MMGIPCDGPGFIYRDNQSVLANTTVPDSTLKKKSQSIAYHFVREKVAKDGIFVFKEDTKTNFADALSKSIVGCKRREIMHTILYK